MEQYAEVVLDLEGNAVPGASVQVVTPGGSPASIFDKSGNPITGNTITTGSRGEFAFQAPNGKYNLLVTVRGSVYATVGPLTFYDPEDDARLTDPLPDTPAEIDPITQARSMSFFTENGARINRINDRLFVGKSATLYDGKGVPVSKSWVGGPSQGIFEYLESNATFGVYAEQSGIGAFFAARSSDTTGTGMEVSIGAATFGYNDRVGGVSGVWGKYTTMLRVAGANGSTLGYEIDVANLGTTAACFPNHIFPAGVTAGLWVASGGEATNNQHVGTASAAMVILSNDGGAFGPVAKFDKGIVFHSLSLAGCDGATGTGVALALAKGHQFIWFNNFDQAMSEIVTTNATVTAAQRLDFTDAGLAVKERTTDKLLFRVDAVAGAANYLAVHSAVGGAAPSVLATGSDTNIDLLLQTKGAGVLQVSYGSSVAATPASFSATRMLAFKDGNGILWYIPISTSPW